jgi:hypothetical protein
MWQGSITAAASWSSMPADDQTSAEQKQSNITQKRLIKAMKHAGLSCTSGECGASQGT